MSEVLSSRTTQNADDDKSLCLSSLNIAKIADSFHHPLKIALLLFAAMIISTAICISLDYVDPAEVSENYATGSRIAILFAILSESVAISFPGNMALLILCFLVLAAASTIDLSHFKSVPMICVSVMLSGFTLLGNYFSLQNDSSDVYEIIKIILNYFGLFCLIFPTVVLTRCYLLSRPRNRSLETLDRVSRFVFCKHSFIVPYAVMLLFWIPYFVICFPGTTDPNDVLDQLQQFHGIYSRTAAWVTFDEDSWLYMNNNNPAFSTILTNLFFDFGKLIGSQNIGMFLLVLLQSNLLLAAFSLSFVLMKKLDVPVTLRYVILAVCAIAPVFPGYAICITKDTLFSCFVLYYILLLICLVFNSSVFRTHKSLYLAFIIVSLLMALMRNNGIYMLVLSAPLLFFTKDRVCKLAACCGCVAIIAYLGFSQILLPAIGVEGGSVKEMLSVPFQQTARYVKTYPDDVTEEQKEAIDAVLDYDSLASSYNPSLSDGVKESYNKDASRSDLSNYFKAWAEMGLAHPVTYFAATASNCYAYFYPGVSTGWIWTQLNRFGAYDAQDISQAYSDSGFDISQNEALRPYRIVLSKWYEIFSKSPLGLFANMGICAWLVCFAVAYFCSIRRLRDLIPYAPIVVLLLVCILSPQNGNPRYALPLICSVPILTAYLARRKPVANSMDLDSAPVEVGGVSVVQRFRAFYKGRTSSSKIGQQGISYLLVGLSSATIELLAFQLIMIISSSIVASNTLAVVISTAFNFFTNRALTFKSSSNIVRSAILYIALLVCNTILSTYVIGALTSVGWLPVVAKLLMMALTVSWNYVLYRRIIFK